MPRIIEANTLAPTICQSEPAPIETRPPTALERAGRKVQLFGIEAQLDLEEAAAVLDVSPSTFERIAIPCVPWTPRGRRWYGAIVKHPQDLEKEWISRWR